MKKSLLALAVTSTLVASGVTFACDCHTNQMTNEQVATTLHPDQGQGIHNQASVDPEPMATQQMLAGLRQTTAKQRAKQNTQATSYRHPTMQKSAKRFYVGMGLGGSEIAFDINDALKQLELDDFSVAEHHYKGFGQTFFVGYNVNQLVDMEVGYVHFAPATYNVHESSPSASADNASSVIVKAQGLSKVVKLHSPVTNGVNFFVKVGVLFTSITQQNNIVSLAQDGSHIRADKRPIETVCANALYGGGLTYQFNDHVSAQAQILHTETTYSNEDNKYFTVPASNLYTVGLSYTF